MQTARWVALGRIAAAPGELDAALSRRAPPDPARLWTGWGPADDILSGFGDVIAEVVAVGTA